MLADTTLLIPAQQLPLFGRRIIITAPRTYALRFAQAILNRGGLPILMPTIETALLSDYSELDACIKQYETINWIGFTSRNGIEALVHRCEELAMPINILNACRLAAIGKDADRLDELGLNVDLLPREPSPQGIIVELAQIPNIQGQSILVPAPIVVGMPEPDVIPNFIAGLEQIGMHVTRVPAYCTQLLDPAYYTVELDLIRQGKVDAIAFSSAGEVAGFLGMFDSPEAYQSCAICCFGPYTAANAQRMGLTPNVVAQDFSSFDGFAEAITHELR